MMRHILAGSSLFVLALVLSGCSQEQPKPGNGDNTKVDGAKYLLASAPEGAKGVIEARKDKNDKKEVVVIGRIGGSKNPWVEGRAAFTIVDLSATPCNEIEGDNCPQPWDYCCEKDLPKKTAAVRVVDDQGKLIKYDAKELLNVKALDTVVVRGVAERDEKGNLTVLAKGIFVKK